MNRKTMLGVVGVLVVVGGVGVAFAATGGNVAASDADLSEDEAQQIAEDHVGGTAQSVELEHEDGPVYEVLVEQDNGDRKEVEVDGNSGEVLEVEDEENGEDDDEDSISASNVSLSEEDAIDIATDEVNGTVEEIELENEDGMPVYEIELVASNGSETEVTVHADEGTVLDIETEDE